MGKPQIAIARAAVVDEEKLPPDIPAGTHASRLVAALRRTRPEVERLLIANNVPPFAGYELLLTALGNVPESFEGVRLDRSLLRVLALTRIRRILDHLSSGGIIPREARRQRQRGTGGCKQNFRGVNVHFCGRLC
jgi:hypothetical protein